MIKPHMKSRRCFFVLSFFIAIAGLAFPASLPPQKEMISIPPTPNDFDRASDSERIEAAIEAAIKSGIRSIEIPRMNARTAKPEWLIERAIVIPSDFTLLLNDCLIRLSPGTQDNIITNAGARTHPLSANRNIRIIGRGNAVLSGGLGAHFNPPGDRSGWRTIGILFYNTQHFSIENLQMEETQAWAISLENGCAYGRVSGIEFKNTNKYPNQDGIDVRKGCHDITIENITGVTGDDTVAITGLLYKQPPNTKSMQLVSEPTDADDIYNITIRNIRATVAGGHHIVRLLNHDGIKIYNVSIDNVMDTSRAGDPRNRAAVKIGDTNYSSISLAQLGDTSRIFVSNVVSRATHVIMIQGTLQDATFRDIVGYDGNSALIHYGKAPIKNLKIEAQQF